MTWFKRVFLFGLVNILIIVTISIVLSLLGVGNYMTAYGLDYNSLAIFCLVWGMGGAFISLLLSKFMVKRMMGVQVIEGYSGQYGHIVQMVHTLAKKAKLTTMPEVGIYDSPEMNAFATGPTRNNALVAVSTGLISRMNRDELEGVIGHEVSHIANGDMVTLTLIQGVINAFVMFLARALTFAIDQAMRNNDDERGGGLGYFAHILLVILFEMVFGILGTMVVAFFSRFREFRADSGSAKIAGKEKMIMALQALQRQYEHLEDDKTAFRAMKISNKGSFLALLATHPPLDERIKALQKATKF